MKHRRSGIRVPAGAQVGGHSVRKVVVDVETLVAWCRGRGRPIDGTARADYVVALLEIADGSA